MLSSHLLGIIIFLFFGYYRLLIERGADVNAVDRKRRTPLEYLEKSMKNNPNLNSVYDLLKSKCSVLSY